MYFRNTTVPYRDEISETPGRSSGQKFFPPLNIGIPTNAVKATPTVNKVSFKGALNHHVPFNNKVLLFAFISDWGSGLVAIGFP